MALMSTTFTAKQLPVVSSPREEHPAEAPRADLAEKFVPIVKGDLRVRYVHVVVRNLGDGGGGGGRGRGRDFARGDRR